jgi:hypothetical protein
MLGDNQRDMLNEELSRICGEQDRFRRERDIQRANQTVNNTQAESKVALQKNQYVTCADDDSFVARLAELG